MSDPARPVTVRIHYILSLIRALTAHGGSAAPAIVYAWLEQEGLRRHQVPPPGVNIEVHYQREVRFARQELADGGVIASDNGTWRIIAHDVANKMDAKAARAMIGDNRRARERRRLQKDGAPPSASLPADLRRNGPTTGPRPAEWQGVVVRGDGPASTYAFRFGATNLRKIGFAADVEGRLQQVNRHVPIELIGQAWKIEKCISWPSQELAYTMEQAVLFALTNCRTMFERLRCANEQLDLAWFEATDLTRKRAVTISQTTSQSV